MPNEKEHYNKLYGGTEFTIGRGKPEIFVQDILKYKETGSVLDIGAGEGRNSLFLAANGFDVEAIDISDTGIAKLQKAAEDQGLKIKTEVGDITELSKEKSFDVIITTFVLHHLPKEKAPEVIRQIKRQTNTGGLNVITAFTKDGDFYRMRPGVDRFYLDKNELKELYKDWEVLEYSEENGEAHQKREDGSSMFNMTASILARKP